MVAEGAAVHLARHLDLVPRTLRRASAAAAVAVVLKQLLAQEPVVPYSTFSA